MIYGSIQAEFMETNIGHIHRYGTPIFGNNVIYVFKPIQNENQILWMLQNIIRSERQSELCRYIQRDPV